MLFQRCELQFGMSHTFAAGVDVFVIIVIIVVVVVVVISIFLFLLRVHLAFPKPFRFFFTIDGVVVCLFSRCYYRYHVFAQIIALV